MKKNAYTTVSMPVGEMRVYGNGKMKLHAYHTGDPINDQVLVVEKDGVAVVVESPCFFDSCKALSDYLNGLGLKVAGVLTAYHMAGASFLPEVRKYATRNADEYGHTGGGKGLIGNFAAAFGESFDASIHTVTDYLSAGEVNIGGIDLVIVPTGEAFDVEIPGLNAVYTHMLGHDCHSIVAGTAHADAILAQLREYERRGFDLILTSHYIPEDLDDVSVKMDYLERMKAIAAESGDKAAFLAAMEKEFPQYSGGNYLEMTAGMFFPQG